MQLFIFESILRFNYLLWKSMNGSESPWWAMNFLVLLVASARRK